MDGNEFLQAIVDSPTRHGIIVTDLDGNIALWNRGAERIFQYDSADIVGSNIRLLFPPDDLARDVPQKEMSRALRGGCAGDFRWHVRKDGSLIWADGMLYPVHKRDGTQLGYLKILRDATDEKRSGDANSRLALEDGLTGLANRTEFNNTFVQMRASAERHGQPLLLMLLDLDHFKDVNDTLGHAFGDALLQQAAHRMRAVVRDSDFIARLGGDEFAVLMPDTTHTEDGGMVADKLVETLSRPFLIDQHEIHVGVSIGISVFPQDASEMKELFAKADVALYRAKDEGRGAYRFYTTGMDARAHLRSLEYAQLRSAIRHRAFSVRYQPRIDTATGRPVAIEALLRCSDPFFQDYPIADVITLATETGRMRRLGLWAFIEALRHIRLWQQQGWPELRLSNNFSRVEYTDRRFAERMCNLLLKVNMAPSQLEIDIPEAQLTGGFDASQLLALHQHGVSIVIDDLGSGGLSLQHLFDLPISSVKLDLRYLPDLPADPRSRAIATAIIELGHNLGIRVIAERVESAAQAAFFLPQCDSIQGHHVARAMTADAMGIWLRQRAPTPAHTTGTGARLRVQSASRGSTPEATGADRKPGKTAHSSRPVARLSRRNAPASATLHASTDDGDDMDAITLLKDDHKKVKALLTELTDTTNRAQKGRAELLAKIATEIEVHTTIEEEIFYPAFQKAGRKGDDNEMFFEAKEEHRAAGGLVLPDLLRTDVTSDQFGGRAKVLKELIEHHADEEEKDMFPRARELLDKDTLADLGQRMQARKLELMQALSR